MLLLVRVFVVRTIKLQRNRGLIKLSGALAISIAYSEYPRCAPPDAPWTPEHTCGMDHDQQCSSPQSCVNTPRAHFTIMGYSVRECGQVTPAYSRRCNAR